VIFEQRFNVNSIPLRLLWHQGVGIYQLLNILQAVLLRLIITFFPFYFEAYQVIFLPLRLNKPNAITILLKFLVLLSLDHLYKTFLHLFALLQVPEYTVLILLEAKNHSHVAWVVSRTQLVDHHFFDFILPGADHPRIKLNEGPNSALCVMLAQVVFFVKNRDGCRG